MKLCIAPLAVLMAVPVFAQNPGMKSEVAAVRIVRKTYGENFKGLYPLNAQKPGTSLVLILQSPKGGMIKVLEKQSKLDVFADDKGTKLLTKGFNQGFGGFPKVSEDGKACMIEINGGGLPTAGAKFVQAKGSATIAIATKKRKVKSKPFAIKTGEKVTVGDVNFVVKAAGKPKWGKGELEIELEAKRDLTEVAAIEFEDAKGTTIKSRAGGSSRFGFGQSVTVTKSFTFEKKTETCVLVLEAWVDKKEVKVPFDVNVGIGG